MIIFFRRSCPIILITAFNHYFVCARFGVPIANADEHRGHYSSLSALIGLVRAALEAL